MGLRPQVRPDAHGRVFRVFHVFLGAGGINNPLVGGQRQFGAALTFPAAGYDGLQVKEAPALFRLENAKLLRRRAGRGGALTQRRVAIQVLFIGREILPEQLRQTPKRARGWNLSTQALDWRRGRRASRPRPPALLPWRTRAGRARSGPPHPSDSPRRALRPDRASCQVAYKKQPQSRFATTESRHRRQDFPATLRAGPQCEERHEDWPH